jgi:hypothetical protein
VLQGLVVSAVGPVEALADTSAAVARITIKKIWPSPVGSSTVAMSHAYPSGLVLCHRQ